MALIIFATGVVTGTILSFEFGLLWPDFMATFGEVFGVAFGLEGISFFLEAIFIAIYVYGWDRLPRKTHFLTGIPIIITGATGSAFVISVNGWMNDPQGFEVVDGRVVDPVPFSALLNGHVAHELVHMYLAGYLVAGFLVAAYYARRWLKGTRDHYTRTALVVPLAFAALAAPIQVVVGDWAARTVTESQPVKLAAFEGLYRTEEGAAVPHRRLLRQRAQRGPLRHQDPVPALDPRQAQPDGRGDRARQRPARGRPPAGQHRPHVRSRR